MSERNKLKDYILHSKIITSHWHWFSYHFSPLAKSVELPFTSSFLDCLEICEAKIPGVGFKYIDTLASINTRKHNEDDYDQLLQVLAEIVVVTQILNHSWDEGSKFEHEPTAGTSGKNPEVLVHEPSGGKYLFEVKAPNYNKNLKLRLRHKTQLPARSLLIEKIDKAKTVFPRDNPIKDFLISADSKFKGFKEAGACFTILIIVSDDYVQEVISPLCSPASGLLTPKSFATNTDGTILNFENVDLVVVTRHLLNIVKTLGGQGPIDNFRSGMDYGEQFNFTPGIGFPPKVLYKNPFHEVTVPEKILSCLQLIDPSVHPPLGAEYIPGEIIFWT